MSSVTFALHSKHQGGIDDGWVWWKADCGVLKVGENKKEEEIGIFVWRVFLFFVFVLFCFVFCIGGVLVVGWGFGGLLFTFFLH